MKLKTEHHTTDVLWVKLPASRRLSVNDFERAMENCVDGWGSVILKDGITVSSEALFEFLDRNDDLVYIGASVAKFLKQVVDIEPMPDEYFVHL